MSTFIAKRLLWLVPVLLGITLLVFSIFAILPGNTALTILGPYATEQRVAALSRELNLDKPWYVQYGTWLSRLMRGDLGHSYALERPVSELLFEHLGPSLLLAGTALLLGSVVGLLLGSLAAVYRGKLADRCVTVLALIGVSVPTFWLALLLILVFSVGLGAFPVSGMQSAFGDSNFGDRLLHLVLPASSLSAVVTGVVARFTRTELMEVMSQSYIEQAHAKGLNHATAICKHALRSALPNLVPVIGLQAGFVLGGAVYVETVFQWPGLGRLLVQAILQRDLLLVQGGVLLVALIYVLLNVLTDVVQKLLDVRLSSSTMQG